MTCARETVRVKGWREIYLGYPIRVSQGSRRRFKKGVQKALFRVQCAMRTVCMKGGVDSAMVDSFFGLVFGLIVWTLSGSESAQRMSSGRRS
jgi:hypothetical protein